MEGVEELAHLIELEFANNPDPDRNAACSPEHSLLLIPAISSYPERRCLDGLIRMISVYQRSCDAIDAARE